MSLNPQFMLAASLQQGFLDKTTGLPLDFGLVFFYSDVNRTVLKPIFTLSGSPPNYSYEQLPNPVILSGIGTIQDGNGNDVIPYYFPFDANGNIELYYIVVEDKFGVQQFTRQAFPNLTEVVTNLLNFSQNLIPNGQFLINNTPASYSQSQYTFDYGGGIVNKVINVAPSWTFQVSNSSTATDTISFTQFLAALNNPSASPRYQINIVRSVPNADAVCDLRVRFMDVNKFQGDSNWSFIFNIESVNALSNVTVKLIKYFGTNSPSGAIADTTEEIDWGGPFNLINGQNRFSAVNTFGINTGKSIGNNNDDFIEFAIRFPATSTSTFNVGITDVMLINAAITSQQLPSILFPPTTNGEFILQALSNLAPARITNGENSNTTNNYYNEDGSNLYLPIMMTQAGFTYDYSQIGKVVPSLSSVPENNELLCDGSIFTSSQYSTLGIPYKRLSNKLISMNIATPGIPMFGTGSNFGTMYVTHGVNTIMRFTNNVAGAGTFASDGTTGWTFGGAVSGFNSISLNATSAGTGELLVSGIGFISPFAPINAGTSGFTVNDSSGSASPTTGYEAFQHYTAIIMTVAASALTNTGGAGKYFQISNSTTTYYFWFFFTNETDPAPGGTGVRINVPSALLTAEDIANMVREAIDGFQSTNITVTSVPTSGKYFLITTNPSSPRDFYVWFNVANAGGDPLIVGRTAIEVDLAGTETNAQVATKTMLAVDAFQFQVPDYRGLFLRGVDPNGTFDLDAGFRSSTISGYSGSFAGTFEYSQFLAHNHSPISGNDFVEFGTGGGFSYQTIVGTDNFFDPTTTTSGGDETRPVNSSVYFYIKY